MRFESRSQRLRTWRRQVVAKVFGGLFVVVLMFAPAFALDEAQTLQVLADQVFQQLHDQYVTLPNGLTERIARSSQQLPVGTPPGTLMGIVAQTYVEQGFAGTTLAELDSGIWITFRNEAEGFDVAVLFRRNQQHTVDIVAKLAAVSISGVSMSPHTTGGNPCESTGDNEECSGTSNLIDGAGNRQGATCSGDSYQVRTDSEGEVVKDEFGNPIYDGAYGSRVGCGSGTKSGSVIMSPR